MTLLRGLGVEDLTKPELTGNWEYQLAEMEKGHLERETFMRSIAQMAERIVKKAKEYDRDTIPGDYATLATPCPNCGGIVKENYRRYACVGIPGEREGCGFSISKIPGGRAFELAEVEAFLRDKRIGPLEGFRSKAGWPFTAEIRLVPDDETRNWKLEFDFGDDARREAESGEPVDFGAQEPLGKCPKTRGNVYEFGANYVCEHSVGPAPTCDFKSGKVILQQPVAREQMAKLLASGATDLLEGFVSNKTRRKFKARLQWDAKEGKVVFAFEPRPERRPAAKKAGAAARPAATVEATDPAPALTKTAVKRTAAKAPSKKTVAKRVAAKKAAKSVAGKLG
jgi:DNA topoisomerase-3